MSKTPNPTNEPNPTNQHSSRENEHEKSWSIWLRVVAVTASMVNLVLQIIHCH
jgi:hypothetical protein